ncbi:unnamed protein product [marine sediment metagenome]|uniref:UspA domain-containing protein n=1 Tax=marine sediment metagenome TaxID=412755 RepID=X1TN41_9ZZZZ
MYSKVIVPLDGSELAECVLPHVETISKGCGVHDVIFVRVVEPFRIAGAREEDAIYINKEDVERINSETIRAADFLVNRGIRLVGVDYLSVGSFKHGGSYVHKTLLGGDIWIIEGLNLSSVTSGKYDLICLPLRIVGGDGTPARAILKPAVGN